MSTRNKEAKQLAQRKRARTRRYGHTVDLFRERFNERAGQEDRSDLKEERNDCE